MRIYACGCRNVPHAPTGALRSLRKCERHRALRRDPSSLGQSYYEELGLLVGGRPAVTRHVDELVEALGPFPRACPGALALEVGCGASPYVAAIKAAGYIYMGIEPSQWAAGWMFRTHFVGVRCASLENLDLPLPVNSLILAAHVLEHLPDAPSALRSLAGMLAPLGELWVIVPDDLDPLNPDHTWFFTAESLRSAAELAGLSVLALETRRYVPHENFLYMRAARP